MAAMQSRGVTLVSPRKASSSPMPMSAPSTLVPVPAPTPPPAGSCPSRGRRTSTLSLLLRPSRPLVGTGLPRRSGS